MKNYKIWISPPHLSGKELDFVKDAFEKNWITSAGDNVNGFETDLQDFIGKENQVVALNSGTSALQLALLLLGVEKGDLVICQDFTFVASINPVAYLEAEPILVDSERETWNMSPEYLEDAIRSCLKRGRKPKAIMWVNLYGMPAKIKEIQEIAKRYEIPLVEDAAESLGSAYLEKKCGSFGDLSILSFNGNKIITTSGGGALLSKRKEWITRARYLSSQAKEDKPYYHHSELGYNYGMSNILAGIGRAQMKVLNDRIEARRSINDFYQKVFMDFPGIEVQKEPNVDYFSNFWLSCILTDATENKKMNPELIRERLANKGIESRYLWQPMHKQPLYKSCLYFGEDVAGDFFNRGLCLPSGSTLTETDLSEIAEIIKTGN